MYKFIKQVMVALIIFSSAACAANNCASEDRVDLYGVKLSPYVRNVINVLEEKNVPYQLHEMLPKSILVATGQDVPVELDEMSPFGRIPFAKYKNVKLADSSIIVAFVEKYSGSSISMYSDSPEGFSKSLWFENYASNQISSVIQVIFVEKVVKPSVLGVSPNQQLVNEKLAALPGILEYLESELDQVKTLYLAGESVSVADFAIANHMLSLDIAEVEWDKASYPNLTRYLDRVFALDSFQAALPQR